MVAAISAFFSRVWVWLGVALVATVSLVGVYAAIRSGGRDAQRLDDAMNVAKRTRTATQARIEAQRPITSKEEANDPFNRDPR